ncbi:MAG: type II toxin-antitoxin system HicA family toxin [Blautia sp.]|nr:type II toxin-antitoxin system HicA family toxin [Blautia sp.]
MTAREILKILHKDGWYEIDQEGSHLQLKHPKKPGKVTVPKHSSKDIAPGTLKRILKQAGLK